jgi:hypothetical protein
MAQLISEKPFAKSSYAKYCQMVRDGTIKQGDPDYDITLAKIKDYAAWQESAGVKVRKTANTAAVRTLLSIKKTGEDTNKRVAGMEPKIDDLHADMQGRHAKQLEVVKKKLEVLQAKDKTNQAFTERIEAGNSTPLEQMELQHKILGEAIRKEKAERALEKAREKAKRTASASLAGPPASTKRRHGESSEEGGGPEAAEAAELGGPSEHATQQKLNKMSIAELRGALREDGKDSTGKKSELVERLLSARTAAAGPPERATEEDVAASVEDAARWQLPEEMELVDDGPEGEASAVASGSGESAERSDTEPEDAAPCSAATSTAEPAPKRPRRNAPKARAAPKREAREYEIGEIVKLNSRNDGKELDGIVKSKAEGGCYWVFVEARGKEIRMRLPQRAASSN